MLSDYKLEKARKYLKQELAVKVDSNRNKETRFTEVKSGCQINGIVLDAKEKQHHATDFSLWLALWHSNQPTNPNQGTNSGQSEAE